ncbi:MAG: 4Fe-4S binding protein, partial [Gammaproteobacteria bacterium]|nr:4Fe-4S binding protein [Gammaproteobacteria bacterium]
MKLFAGGPLVVGLTGCGPPHEGIVPYVDMPERLVPGEPLRFATTLALDGYGQGVLATSLDGRPIKIEGNPQHPASRGATDVFSEAALISLYDPDRSQAPRRGDLLSTWNAFASALHQRLETEQAREGEGLRLLTSRITSPTLQRQIDAFLTRYPRARWHAYTPLADADMRAGTRRAFGRELTALPRLAEATVLLVLDADPLGPGPAQIANARAFADRKDRGTLPFSRAYVIEPAWTLTGANADHRLELHPSWMRNVALAIANMLDGTDADAQADRIELPGAARRFVEAATADLRAHRGHALIIAGPRSGADVQALCHWINATLDAPLTYVDPVDAPGRSASLAELTEDLRSDRVRCLFVVDANPAYDTASAAEFAGYIEGVPFSVHLGLHDDETAACCDWHLPQSHALESWSDLRALDGTASLVQPLIRPLYDSRTAHDLLDLLNGRVEQDTYSRVRETWRQTSPVEEFEQWWRRALHDGVIADSAPAPIETSRPERPVLAPAAGESGLTLVLAPDPSAWDGCFANNPWLQECPHPLTGDAWGNVIQISTADANARAISNGAIVRLAHGGRQLTGPARVCDGQAEGVVALTLGHGRSRAGRIGNGIGIDVYPLRRNETPWQVDDVSLDVTADRVRLTTLQQQFGLDEDSATLYPSMAVTALTEQAHSAESQDQPSLLPSPKRGDPAWAMVIDTTRCIGCNACVVACQAEN